MSRGGGLAKLCQALEDHDCAVRGNRARCPGPNHKNGDRTPSLAVDQGDEGAILKCHVEPPCPTDAILEALGMSAADLFDEPRKRANGRAYEVVATYAYTDEVGVPLFYAERRVPKRFLQYRMVNGRKVWKLGGVRLVLYRLPKVIEAVRNGETVFVAEGEADVHAIEAAGGVATCNPMGAGKWRPEFGDVLKGAAVIVVADKDPPGYGHAAEVRADLAGKAASVIVVEAAEGKDAADHLAAGHGLDGFRQLAEPDGAQVLDAVRSFLCAYVAFPSAAAAVAVTLWAAHTHLVGRFESTPRLALLSPEKQCGKSRVLELLELVCAGAETLSGASAAYLYRRIGAGEVTILLDEADAIWKRGQAGKDETAEALRSIVNAGHRRSATVGRVEMVGQRAELTRFRCYAPAAIAGIGILPDTIMDRAAVIHMRRRAPGERIRDYRERTTRPEGEQLRDELARWAASVAGRVGEPWPRMPPGVADRPADVWEPLLMVADLAGGDWPKQAAEACAAFVAGARDDTASIGTRLLEDLRGVFGSAEALWTETILGGLHEIDEAPWGDWYGHPLNPRDLAKLLRPYGARSRDVRIGADHRKGYYRADLRDVWQRYAPAVSATSATSASALASTDADVADVADTRQACTVCGGPLDQVLINAGFTDHGEEQGSGAGPCRRCGERSGGNGGRSFCQPCITEVNEENRQLGERMDKLRAEQEAELEHVQTWTRDRLVAPLTGKRRQRETVQIGRHPTGWIPNLGDDRTETCNSVFDLGADGYHAFHDPPGNAVVWKCQVWQRQTRSTVYYCDAHLPDEFRPKDTPRSRSPRPLTALAAAAGRHRATGPASTTPPRSTRKPGIRQRPYASPPHNERVSGRLARCTGERACPRRWADGGPDRNCGAHEGDDHGLTERATALGIMHPPGSKRGERGSAATSKPRTSA